MTPQHTEPTDEQTQDGITVVKGNPTDEQVAALTKLVDGLTQQANESRKATVDTRGWYGAVSEPRRRPGVYNPSGFRTPRMPRDNR